MCLIFYINYYYNHNNINVTIIIEIELHLCFSNYYFDRIDVFNVDFSGSQAKDSRRERRREKALAVSSAREAPQEGEEGDEKDEERLRQGVGRQSESYVSKVTSTFNYLI